MTGACNVRPGSVSVAVWAGTCTIPAAPKKAAIITERDQRLAIGQHADEKLLATFFIVEQIAIGEVMVVHQRTASG